MVEKNNHSAAQRWGRNLLDELTPEQAQQSLARFATSQDRRRREGRDGSTIAAAMFIAEQFAPLPLTLFSVVKAEHRLATRPALTDWRGNRYLSPAGAGRVTTGTIVQVTAVPTKPEVTPKPPPEHPLIPHQLKPANAQRGSPSTIAEGTVHHKCFVIELARSPRLLSLMANRDRARVREATGIDRTSQG